MKKATVAFIYHLNFLKMKTSIIIIIIILVFFSILKGQEITENTYPLKANQKVALNLKFAENIKVENWDKNELLLKAEVNINDNTLNNAHIVDVKNEGILLNIETGFNDALLKNSRMYNCNGDNAHQNNFNGKDGYSVCSKINYTVYLPANTELTIETISGNIVLAERKGPLVAKSISGFVDLSTAENKQADIYLKSISGEVYTDLDIVFANREENPIVGYELKGKLNGGGDKVRLESISGDVYLRKR